MGTTSIYVPRESSSCLRLLQRLSKNSNWLWLGLISNYSLCAECWSGWDFMCALSEQNLCFLQTSGFLILKLWRPSKSGAPVAHLPSETSSGWGAIMGRRPLTSWGASLLLWLSSFLWLAYLGGIDLEEICLYPSYPCHCGSFFISLIVEDRFYSSLGVSCWQLLCKLL